jgi:hypothetical protein
MTATCGRTPNAERQTPNAKRQTPKRCDTMATAVFASSERAAPFWFLVRAKPGMQWDSRHYQAPNAHRRERCCLRRTV